MSQLTAIRIKKYRGANILIINKWQNFIAIIFYKGQFFQTELEATPEVKRKDYTAREYAIACDAMLNEAKKVVNAIRAKRSLKNRLRQYASYIRLSIGLPPRSPKEGPESEGRRDEKQSAGVSA